MLPVTRRWFLLSSAALSAGCALNRGDAGATKSARAIRPPRAGQTWRYAKHDVFTQDVVDIQIDEVAAVDRTIVIHSRTAGSDAADAARTPGGLSWLRHYFDHPKPAAVLPNEVQEPWGMILVDAHWSQVQVYDAPIPLWPAAMMPGWQAHFRSKYSTAEGGAPLPWAQTMKAEAWENISVPAGQFDTLRYSNFINFTDADNARTGSVRRETVWFAPEVGRWVARESTGTYYLQDSVIDTPYDESSFRWELLDWEKS